MSTKRVLSVGQCAADHWGIERTLHEHFEAEVESATTHTEALRQIREGEFDLVLVNRLFDADGSSGLDLIKQITRDASLQKTPVMLVSNYENAQRQAVAAGAVPGFGKAALGQPAMLSAVSKYLAK